MFSNKKGAPIWRPFACLSPQNMTIQKSADQKS